MLGLLTASTVLAEEWIGLDDEPPMIIGFQYSEEEQGDHSRLVYLSVPVASTNSLDVNYSQTTLIDEDIRFDSDSLYAGINVEIDELFAISLNYQFQGRRNELEIERYGFQLIENPYPFSAQLGYSFGEVLIFTQQDIFPNANIPENIQSDMDVLEVQLGWWFDRFGINISHRNYEYQKQLSALGSRPLFQLLVKPGVLVQTGLLLAEQTDLSLQFPLEQRSLILYWSSSRSEVDDSRAHSLQMDWTEYLTEQTGLLISVGRFDDSNWHLGLGLEWIL
jgi:hypothetical protein